MTSDELEAIKARCDKATPGPWRTATIGPVMYCGVVEGSRIAAPDLSTLADFVVPPANADFVAHARHDIPALVAEVERLTAILAEPCDRCFDTGVENVELRREVEGLRGEVKP